MERQKNKKTGILDRIRSALVKNDMLSAIPEDYRIEMHGKKGESRVLIGGVRRILACNSECVVLQSKAERFCFNGTRLECLCYERGIAEISGIISSLSIEGEVGV